MSKAFKEGIGTGTGQCKGMELGYDTQMVAC